MQEKRTIVSKNPRPEPSMSLPPVLVVDDDEDFCEVLTKGLRNQGFEVSYLTSAVDALTFVSNGSGPIVVVADIVMNPMSGIEFLQKLRVRAGDRPVISLVMTGSPTQERAIAACRADVRDFIQKPVDAIEIAEAVMRAWRHSTLAREARESEKEVVSRLGFLKSHRRLRESRLRLLGAHLFSDPSWDILLELLIAAEEGAEVTTTSLCVASQAAPGTSLRRIDQLVREGFVTKEQHPSDKRRQIIRLTPDAHKTLVSIFNDHAHRIDVKITA